MASFFLKCFDQVTFSKLSSADTILIRERGPISSSPAAATFVKAISLKQSWAGKPEL